MSYKLIIFDCDGVLVDSEFLSSQVMADILVDIGLNISAQEVFDTLRGGSMTTTIKFVEGRLGGPIPIDLEKEYRKKTFEVYKDKMTPITGAEEILKQLNIPCCVGSNGPQNKIKLNLEVTGLDKYFMDSHIFSAYDVNKWKPDPTLYLHAAKMLGYDPTDCLVIEDSIGGATAARDAGMDCYGYTADTLPNDFAEVGATPISQMSDIKVLSPSIFN